MISDLGALLEERYTHTTHRSALLKEVFLGREKSKRLEISHHIFASKVELVLHPEN